MNGKIKAKPMGKEAVQLQERWHSDPTFIEHRKTVEQALGFHLSIKLGKLRGVDLPLHHGKKDLRGFDWNYYSKNPKVVFRNLYGSVQGYDFSYSNFKSVRFFSVSFRECGFGHSRFIGGGFIRSRISQCYFMHCDFQGFRIGLNSFFNQCDFSSSSKSSRGLDFGSETKYLKCKFEDVAIKKIMIEAVSFIECSFSGILTSVRILGAKHAEFNKPWQKLCFWRKKRIPRFVNCSFQFNEIKNLIIHDGVEFIGEKMVLDKPNSINTAWEWKGYGLTLDASEIP